MSSFDFPSPESLFAAELAIVGAMLDEHVEPIIDDLELSYGDFLDRQCGGVYHLIKRVHASKTAPVIDPVTIDRAVRASDDVDLRGVDYQWLMDAYHARGSVVSVPAYVELVRAASTRRRIDAGARAIHEAAQTEMPPDELVDLARREIDAAGRVDTTSPLESASSRMAMTIQSLRNPVRGCKTPWPTFNEITGGLVGGRLYVIGARPSVGKSVIAVQLALSMAADGGYVSFTSLEMSTDDINERLIAHDLRINMSRMKPDANYPLGEDEWRKIDRYEQESWHPTLMINDDPGATFSSVRRHARSVAAKGELKGIIVDYLQLMSPEFGDSNRKRHEVVGDYSRQLKNLARELNVPVIALAQLNRDSAGDGGGPQLHHLRESGAVEQDADVVMLLDRDIIDPSKKNDMKVLVAKNRQGETRLMRFDFYGQYSLTEESSGDADE